MRGNYKFLFKNHSRFYRLFKTECIICGIKENLTFHHIDKTKKKHNISEMKKCLPAKIIDEILKCVVLCRDCHDKVEDSQNEKNC